MDVEDVPMALRERLGVEGTTGLLQVFGHARDEWKDYVIAACTDRFERRLVEEIAGVRVQLAQLGASLRQEIAESNARLQQQIAGVKTELQQQIAESSATLREQIAASVATLRQEMAQSSATLRQEFAKEMATGRVDLIKWCFLFWIGQVVAMTAIIGVLLRLTRG